MCAVRSAGHTEMWWLQNGGLLRQGASEDTLEEGAQRAVQML